MDTPKTPFESPESETDMPEMSATGRRILRSGAGRVLVRITIAILLFVFISKAGQTYRVWDLNIVEPGSFMWVVIILSIASYLATAACALLLIWLWQWAALAWALAVTAIGLLGFGMGLDLNFLIRWDVFLPWVVLGATLYYEKPFGEP